MLSCSEMERDYAAQGGSKMTPTAETQPSPGWTKSNSDSGPFPLVWSTPSLDAPPERFLGSRIAGCDIAGTVFIPHTAENKDLSQSNTDSLQLRGALASVCLLHEKLKTTYMNQRC